MGSAKYNEAQSMAAELSEKIVKNSGSLNAKITKFKKLQSELYEVMDGSSSGEVNRVMNLLDTAAKKTETARDQLSDAANVLEKWVENT